MNSLLRKMYVSIMVDIRWLQTPGIPYRCRYLIKKYLFLLFPYAFWNKKSRSYPVRLFGHTVHLPTVEHVAFLQGTFTDHAYLKRFISPGATVVDIGAHVGEFALVCKNILHAKNVYSFEPLAHIYSLLLLNTPFHAYHAAVGTKKEQRMHIPSNTVAASGIATTDTKKTELSPCLSPDDIKEIASWRTIDLLKIDVEGMEYDVLTASKETVRKSRYILLELSIDRPSTRKAMDTIALLRTLVPNVELVHVGMIFMSSDFMKQLAVDMLFHNREIV